MENEDVPSFSENAQAIKFGWGRNSRRVWALLTTFLATAE
jgi:hypothetical protein